MKGELIQYKNELKFLGITLDQNLSFKAHIQDIVSRSRKRLNLIKALRGKNWGADPSTLLYTYKTYIRPLLEYGCLLFAHSDEYLLNKIQAVETEAIKVAYQLPPWTTNYWCYNLVKFDNILNRMKHLGRNFLDKNAQDPLIKPLIDDSKPSMSGKHSPVFKILNW